MGTEFDIAVAKAGLSKKASDLYRDTLMLGGLEMHDDHCKAHNVRELVRTKLVEFGPRRGPDGAWRRMWAIEDEERV